MPLNSLQLRAIPLYTAMWLTGFPTVIPDSKHSSVTLVFSEHKLFHIQMLSVALRICLLIFGFNFKGPI